MGLLQFGDTNTMKKAPRNQGRPAPENREQAPVPPEAPYEPAEPCGFGGRGASGEQADWEKEVAKKEAKDGE